MNRRAWRGRSVVSLGVLAYLGSLLFAAPSTYGPGMTLAADRGGLQARAPRTMGARGTVSIQANIQGTAAARGSDARSTAYGRAAVAPLRQLSPGRDANSAGMAATPL